MSYFYTNVALHRDDILVRGVRDGKRFQERVPYTPYVFVRAKNGQAPYHTIKGEPVEKFDLGSIREARDFINRYREIANFPIYGLTNFVYTYINDSFPGTIKHDDRKINVGYLDIEVSSDGGFPSVETADKEVIAITIRRNGLSAVFGCGVFKTADPSITYIKCKDERDLLDKFLMAWNSKHINLDVVTGWNVAGFDIPYLINRLDRIFTEGKSRELSPWKLINTREVTIFGKVKTLYDIVGIAILDYLDLYKKFAYTPQVSYALQSIAMYELKEGKLDYSQYESLDDLFQKDYQKFIEYNIHDVALVEKLDHKLGFINQVFSLAYDAKVNFVDTFTTVKMWDVIIHNELLQHNIVIPPQSSKGIKERSIEGAYVKDPQLGLHHWVVSFDITSLYPHLIMQYNISPETLWGHVHDLSVDQLLNGELNQHHTKLDKENITTAATGFGFTKDFQGFLPKLMESVFNQRAFVKKEMLKHKQELKDSQLADKSELEAQLATLNNLQQALKIKLNSAYGALSNDGFRWFDDRLAESITKSGQLTIRWAEKHVNQFLNKHLNTTDVDYVIASDTDSLYISFESIVKHNQWNENIVQHIDEFCKTHLEPLLVDVFKQLAEYTRAFQQKIHMKRESIGDKGIWKAKKRYILNVWNNEGVQYKEPELKMMGIEAIRSSTPPLARSSIEQAIKIIVTKTEDELINFIENVHQKFIDAPFEEIAFPRTANGLNNYSNPSTIYNKSTPIHVKGSLIYNHFHKKLSIKSKPTIQEGEKIRFCYLKQPNPIHDSVIACSAELPKELKIDQYLDREMQFSKGFLEPIKSITDIIGWHTEHKSTLEGFFA